MLEIPNHWPVAKMVRIVLGEEPQSSACISYTGTVAGGVGDLCGSEKFSDLPKGKLGGGTLTWSSRVIGGQ